MEIECNFLCTCVNFFKVIIPFDASSAPARDAGPWRGRGRGRGGHYATARVRPRGVSFPPIQNTHRALFCVLRVLRREAPVGWGVHVKGGTLIVHKESESSKCAQSKTQIRGCICSIERHYAARFFQGLAKTTLPILFYLTPH